MTKAALYPAEKITLLFLLLCLALYQWAGVSLRDPVVLYSTRLVHSLIFYTIGLLLLVFGCRLRDLERQWRLRVSISRQQTWERYQQAYLTKAGLVHDLRLVHCVALMFTVFINLKHLIPLINPRIHDQQFAAWELSLFAGKTAGEWLQIWLGLEGAYILSPLYTLFYSYVALILFYMIFTKRYAQEFIACFCLLWFLGIMVVYIWPSWGPVFFIPELYKHLPFTEVSELQRRLLEHREFLLLHPKSDKGVYLISGFPSLHLAIPILGSYYLWSISRALAVLSWAFVGATILTTLYFGWHWVVDDMGSVILVVAVLAINRICNFGRHAVAETR